MSKIEVDAIDKQSGSTLTLGGSGTAVTLASGATQSGFGREGSVNWQTSIKTATFTAASGEGYFCNTSGGAFTVNLPSSPSVGDIVSVKDYAGTFDTQNLTIGRGGSNMNGSAADSVRNTENESLTLVYADATKGWLAVEEGTGFVGESFIAATGGTITCSGNFKIHTFTGPGTFEITKTASAGPNNSVDYLVVAGGGGGGQGNNASGGGGGAGGLRFSASTFTAPPTSAPRAGSAITATTAASFPITVGAGSGRTPTSPNCGTVGGQDGNNSSFSTITSTGGGGGGSYDAPVEFGRPGGSGGGGAGDTSSSGGAAGLGNTPPTTPSQGNNGGAGIDTSPDYPAGGGGGAGGVGTTQPHPGPGGPGGVGLQINIDTNTHYYSGGGGGSVWETSTGGNGGTGGGGGGGAGPGAPAAGTGGGCAVNTGGAGVNNWPTQANGGDGGANTGGGGGGNNKSPPGSIANSAGGSGIVIIRYKFQ